MTQTVKFSLVQILKGIGVAIPIAGLLLAGYINIMIKLTSLEEKIVYGQQNYITLVKEIEVMKATDKQIQYDLTQHMLESAKSTTDDTFIPHKKIKRN